jgi:hypothetical protein
MPAWIIPAIANPGRQAHWLPNHTLAAGLLPHEPTNCNLQVQQLPAGTYSQQSGVPADTNGVLSWSCAKRPDSV